MAFPTTPLQVRVDLNLNGAWTNVTGDTYAGEKINITRGRQDETSAPQASACTFVLNNRTGNYTPKNPNGIYYGQIGRNTAVRIGIGVPPQGTATGAQSGTSIVAPSVVAEAAGIVLSMYAQQSNSVTLTGPAGYTLAAQQVGASATGLTSLAGIKIISLPGTVAASTTTSTGSQASSACSLFIPCTTSASVTSINPANGTYSFFNTAFGPVAQTSTITVSPGDVLIALVAWSADARDAMVTAPIDQTQSVEWTLVADSGGPASGTRVQAWARYCPVADSTIVQAPGECYGLNDTQMVVYQVTGAASWNPRYTGACADFSTTADLSGNDVRTTIAAGQILRQRGQGQQAQNSCLYRYITDKQPLAYWPLESGTLGGVFNSPIAGVQPAIPFAVSSGADSSSFVASDSLPQTAANGSIAFPVPTYTAATNAAGSVFFLLDITATAGPPSTIFNVRFKNDGTTASLSSFSFQFINDTTCRFLRIDGTHTAQTPGAINIPTLAGAASGGSITGLPVGVFIGWNPTSGAPTTQVDFRIALVTTNGIVGDSRYPGQVGTVGQVLSMGAALDPDLAVTPNVPITFGHVLFDPFATAVTTSPDAGLIPPTRVFPNSNCSNIVTSFSSEPVSLRLRRICQDESIFLSSPILMSESTDTNNVRHGPQTIDNGLDLISLLQITDGGELAEARGFNGFLYRPLGALASRPVVQALDYSAKMIADPFAPATDDQLVRNDVTISQVNGSSARATAITGTLSSLPPPNGVGTYTSSLTVDVAQQARDLQQIANWNLAIGTYDAERFKEIKSLLEAVPASVMGLSLIDIGNHIQVVNTPAWIQTGPTDLLVIGLTELIGTVAEWEITYNGRPYGQFNVLRANGGDAFARLDSGSSTLTTGVASGVTSLSITTANARDLWSTTAAPFDIILSGERMTVTAITGSTSPQTFTVTRSVNGITKAQVAGTPTHVFYATYLGLNGGS